MNRKILAILAILVIAASTTAIYAASAGDTIKVDGFEFNVPDGYVEDKTMESIDKQASVGGLEYSYCQKVFEKSPTEVFTILVAKYDGYDVTDEVVKAVGGDKTTISGIDGYLDFNNKMYTFNYPKDGKLVTITTPDKEIIGDIIIK